MEMEKIDAGWRKETSPGLSILELQKLCREEKVVPKGLRQKRGISFYKNIKNCPFIQHLFDYKFILMKRMRIWMTIC